MLVPQWTWLPMIDTLLCTLIASQENNIEVVTLLIDGGASADLATEDGYTSLQNASAENNIEVVTLLIDGGASSDLANDDGHTPLYAAFQENNIEVVALLIDGGASVDLAADGGRTPLYTASERNHNVIEVMKQLLEVYSIAWGARRPQCCPGSIARSCNPGSC